MSMNMELSFYNTKPTELRELVYEKQSFYVPLKYGRSGSYRNESPSNISSDPDLSTNIQSNPSDVENNTDNESTTKTNNEITIVVNEYLDSIFCFKKSLNLIEKQLFCLFKVEKPLRDRLFLLEFYLRQFKVDHDDNVVEFITEEAYGFLKILKRRIQSAILLMRMIVKMKLNGEPKIETVLREAKYELRETLNYQVKLKEIFYGLRSNVMSILNDLEQRLYLSATFKPSLFEEFVRFTKETGSKADECVEISKEIESIITRAMGVVDCSVNSCTVTPIVEKRSLYKECSQLMGKLTLPEGTWYDNVPAICYYVNFFVIRKITESAMDEVFNRIGPRSLQSNRDTDEIYGKSILFEDIKNEIQAKITDSNKYRELVAFVAESQNKMSLTNDEKEIKTMKINIVVKTFRTEADIKALIGHDLTQLERKVNHMDLKLTTFYESVTSIEKRLQHFTDTVEKLFRIFDRVPESSSDGSSGDAKAAESGVEEAMCGICLKSIKMDDSNKYIGVHKGYPAHKCCMSCSLKYRLCSSCHYCFYRNYNHSDNKFRKRFMNIDANGRLDSRSGNVFMGRMISVIRELKLLLKSTETIYWDLVKNKSKFIYRPSIFSRSYILRVDSYIERILRLKIQSLISPINDIKRLIDLAFDLSRLNGLELNHNYI